MPRPSKGARLWLRPARKAPSGVLLERSRWIIKDDGRQFSTGCGAEDREGAERQLQAHLASKYEPARRERKISEISVADVVFIYLKDVAPGHANPERTAERAERLLDYFGRMSLIEITGATCRAYVAHRAGKGRTNKGTGGGAKRDLQTLSAAVSHHHRQGLHREVIKVVLPKHGQARERWMTRDEVARLLWTCWRMREVQRGKQTSKRPLRHLCRLLLLGIYTGSRPGAVLNATWDRGPGRSWVDVDKGLFHRKPEGKAETTKRQPTVKLAPRLLAHLRRWKRTDGDRGYVVTFDGHPVESTDTALRRAWMEAGLTEPVTAYAMRHTCGAWLVSKGMPTRKVADFLGTSEQMIWKHYGHLSPSYQDEAAAAIGRK